MTLKSSTMVGEHFEIYNSQIDKVTFKSSTVFNICWKKLENEFEYEKLLYPPPPTPTKPFEKILYPPKQPFEHFFIPPKDPPTGYAVLKMNTPLKMHNFVNLLVILLLDVEGNLLNFIPVFFTHLCLFYLLYKLHKGGMNYDEYMYRSVYVWREMNTNSYK